MTWNTIGFSQQKKYFEKLIKEESLSHAYLLTGPEMIGKLMLAKEITAKANSRELENNPDVTIVAPRVEEGETKIYIEDIRDVKSFLSLKPYFGPYKFVIINDADRLTPEASNGLLKALEEPNPKSVLILITNKPKQLLSTIQSRCQEVSFQSHDSKTISEFLAEKKIKKEDLVLLTAMAQGRIGWLNQILESKEITKLRSSVEEFQKVLNGGLTDRMLYAKKIFENESYPRVIASWIYWAYANKSTLPNSSATLGQLSRLHSLINQPQLNHRLLLENTLINL
ncbi:AAA family ATPase [Candidatus Parcubacteria bacterium]|nr:AAA family ATPase [Candidatus Parcubacteria bacterium]